MPHASSRLSSAKDKVKSKIDHHRQEHSDGMFSYFSSIFSGREARQPDSAEAVDAYFSKTPPQDEWDLSNVQKELQSFLQHQHVVNDRHVALVTSGATLVPLDAACASFVDLSTHLHGYQGPACAEYLLSLGYAVIFLHRQDSLQPFSRHFQKYIQHGAFLNMFRENEQGEMVLDGLDLTQRMNLQRVLHQYHNTSDRLLNLSFTSVQHYLHLLKLSSQAVDIAGPRCMLVLAATVMHYGAPGTEKNALPPSSGRRKSGLDFSVQFQPVPNLIGQIRHKWCPRAFLVTLKNPLKSAHYVNTGERLEAAYDDLERWGVHVVAGSYQRDTPDELLLVSEHEETIVSCPEGEDINDAFAASVAKLHREFRRTTKVLAKSKGLLLLSAKFSMLREDDVVEDADGNKGAKFGPGVKIRADRRAGESAPVYELKHIFKNRSHCARVHVWEANVEKEDGSIVKDVVVACSPAGTPNTIRDMWGDFWSGWAEDEIDEFKQQLSSVSFSNALDVVALSIAGDYTSASNLLVYMFSKMRLAWSKGEQTRIRQSLQNMISVSFDRGLIEPSGISSLEELTTRPRIQRFESLQLEPEDAVVHPKSRPRRDSDEMSDSEPVRMNRAKKVRVHRAVNTYLEDMIKDGLIDAIMPYVEEEASIHVTGYSMGGMLGQLIMMHLGDRARMQGLDTSRLNLIGFGTPRVGDMGFASRLRLMFDPEQLLIVMHPSDVVHAFPPTSEGYVDACHKIFLHEDGLGLGRRTASTFSLLPVAKSIDKMFQESSRKSQAENTDCNLCGSKTHPTAQHRCRYCTERGTHRGSDCPNRDQPCMLCGHSNHCTGEHKCKVCQQHGHRGRECHAQRDVGVSELLTFFRYHHFLYYNSNLKTAVEFTAE